MTPPKPSLASMLAYTICGRKIHVIARGSACPECKARNYAKTKDHILARMREKWIHATPEQREKRKRYIREHAAKQKSINQERYRSDPDYREERKRKAREYAEKNRERGIWKAMIQRCFDPRHKSFKDYGGRGIGVCERWLCENGLENFLSDMGKRSSERHTLERIDNNKGYGPDNCAWETRNRQCRNRRNSVMITIGGETKCLADWVDEYGANYRLVAYRISRFGWDPLEALTSPARALKRRVEA